MQLPTIHPHPTAPIADSPMSDQPIADSPMSDQPIADIAASDPPQSPPPWTPTHISALPPSPTSFSQLGTPPVEWFPRLPTVPSSVVAHKAALSELMLYNWRIVQAVKALPEDPPAEMVSRFNAGLTREAVSPSCLMPAYSAQTSL